MDKQSSSLEFFDSAFGLKDLPRAGWVKRNVESPESVGDHSFATALMCMMLPIDSELQSKAIRMALVHDLGESIIGDITPSDQISKGEKHTREKLAIEYQTILLRKMNPEAADDFKDLWLEFEEGKSDMARMVKQVDILERAFQAKRYAANAQHLTDFLDFPAELGSVDHPKVKPYAEKLLREWEALQAKGVSHLDIVFVIGGPGVGKGTQCIRAAEEFDFIHISAGDLLREEAESPDSAFRDFINQSMKESVIIPASLTVGLLKARMAPHLEKGRRRFLIDGFPRSEEQAKEFEKKVQPRYSTLLMECSKEQMQERIKNRSESSSRIDDNPESTLKRLETFQTSNASVVKYLQNRGPLQRIHCAGPIEEVYSSVRTCMSEFLDSSPKKTM